MYNYAFLSWRVIQSTSNNIISEKIRQNQSFKNTLYTKLYIWHIIKFIIYIYLKYIRWLLFSSPMTWSSPRWWLLSVHLGIHLSRRKSMTSCIMNFILDGIFDFLSPDVKAFNLSKIKFKSYDWNNKIYIIKYAIW